MTRLAAMKQALEGKSLYEITGSITDIDKCIIHRFDLIQAIKAIATEESSATQEPVKMMQVYRCKIKSRKLIDIQIPREKQGWWADVSAGQLIRLREATQADLNRCSLNKAHSKNPADYMCETFTNGSLVSKIALEYMNPEQNVFAAIGETHPQPKAEQERKPLNHEQRFDLLTAFEPHKNKWEAPAILIDMVEIAHGIIKE